MTAHRFSRYGVLGAVLIGLLVTPLAATEDAAAVVEKRSVFMKSLGKANKAFSNMLRGKTSYDPVDLLDYAETMYEHSQRLLDYFPEGSTTDQSEARPSIWHNWAKFEDLAALLSTESGKLVEMVQSADEQAVRRQFAHTAAACKYCHQKFRQKKVRERAR